jgi:type III secretory pathway component EscS
MQTLLSFSTLLPIAILLLQAFIILFLSIVILKKLRLLKTPYAGMEYSQVIVAAAIIFGAFYISLSDIPSLFQAYKTYANQQEHIFNNTFSKFSQFFLVVLLFEILFVLVVYAVTKIILGARYSLKEMEDGNLPVSILLAVIITAFALVLHYGCKELVDFITPKFISFR